MPADTIKLPTKVRILLKNLYHKLARNNDIFFNQSKNFSKTYLKNAKILLHSSLLRLYSEFAAFTATLEAHKANGLRCLI